MAFGARNDGQAALAPGCDTANIWIGFPGTPYTADRDSHILDIDGGVDEPAPRRLPLPDALPRRPGLARPRRRVARLHARRRPGSDLSRYAGTFLSSDDVLNKAWYAGAYTVQLNTDRPTPRSMALRAPASATTPTIRSRRGPRRRRDLRRRQARPDRLAGRPRGPAAGRAAVHLRPPAVDNSLSCWRRSRSPTATCPQPAWSAAQRRRAAHLRRVRHLVRVQHGRALALHRRPRLPQRWWPAMQRAVAWLEGQRDDTRGLLTRCQRLVRALRLPQLRPRDLQQRALRQPRPDGRPRRARRHAPTRTRTPRAEAVRPRSTLSCGTSRSGPTGSAEIPTRSRRTATRPRCSPASPRRRPSGRCVPPLHNWTARLADRQPVHPQRFAAAVPRTAADLVRGRRATGRNRRPAVLEQQAASTWCVASGAGCSPGPGSTFWEHVLPGGDPNLAQFSSLAHGWAAGPTVSMTTKVLGVSPTEPGFSRFEVRRTRAR